MKLFTKARVAMVVAEFFGTALLTTAVLTVSKSQLGIPFFVALAAGVTTALAVAMFGKVSGAIINPALTLGLLSIRKIRFEKAFVYLAVQLLGAVAAFKLNVWITKPEEIKLVTFGSIDWRIFACEALGMLVFSMVVAAALSRNYRGIKLGATAGMGLFLGIVIASAVTKTDVQAQRVTYSDGVVNPAVALGTQHYGFEYLIAPVVASVVGMNLYTYVFADRNFGSGFGRAQRNSSVRTGMLSTSSTARVVSEPSKPIVDTKNSPTKKKKSARKR